MTKPFLLAWKFLLVMFRMNDAFRGWFSICSRACFVEKGICDYWKNGLRKTQRAFFYGFGQKGAQKHL